MNNTPSPGDAAPIRILIADDHEVFREGLKVMLRRVPGAQLVGEAADGFAVLRMARELKPDLVILDIRMPRMNGLHAVRRLKQDNPQVKILALSALDELKMVRLLLRCGVSGYILKTDLIAELVKAVETVARGGTYVSGKLPQVHAAEFAPEQSPDEAMLNAAQREVLHLKRSGLAIEQIAAEMLLSVRTVQRHLRQIDSLELGTDSSRPNGT